MEPQTTEFLEKLANKLGTTAEYLWNVLIHQAPISGLINIGAFLFILLFGFGLYLVHKKLLKEDKDGDTVYENYEGAGGIMVVLSISWLICFIVSVATIGTTITAFINPEYWALKEILGSIN